MFTETYSVKGMVCQRCIMVLRDRLAVAGLQVDDIGLGTFTLRQGFTAPEDRVKEVLSMLGFELLSNRQARLVAAVKEIISDSLTAAEGKRSRLSDLLSSKLSLNYDSISQVFSMHEGITIEHYVINLKISRVKALIAKGNLSLTDISYQTSYSSVQHLSRQFKQVEGITPGQYRALFSS